MASRVALFHPDARLALRIAIAEAGGNEVFFVGRPGPDHLVAEVQVLARGHASAVPAVLRGARAGETVIHNHPSGDLTPSEPDLAIASHGASLGLAFVIVDNRASDAYVVVEPMTERPRVPVEDADIDGLLGPGGRVASALEGYEHRREQVAMAREVARALNEDQVLAVEAGTGTGKSLAYLLPAILHATRNRERVVVSTNTINLQEQLVGKDLPFLRDRLGLEFKSVLLKGRSNYLCLRKADFARREGARLVDDARASALASVLEWAEKTADGSRSDLTAAVPEDVWDEVASDGDDCLRVRSPFFGRCFYFQSRREAASADLVVVNHHLLLADLAARAATGDWTGTAVLPPYDRVVLDEAHHLEDVASSYFGTLVGAPGLLRSLGRLQSDRDPRRGVLPALADRFSRDLEAEERLGEALALRAEAAALVRDAFARIATSALGWLGVDDPGGDDLRLRLKPEVLAHPALVEGVVPECVRLVKGLGELGTALTRASEAVRRSAGEDPEAASPLMRVDAVRARLDAACEAIAAFPRDPRKDPGACRWIEVRRARSGEIQARLASAPLEVAPLLAERLFSRMKSVVLTSATLTVGGRFEHFVGRWGADRGAAQRLRTGRHESPFDWERQALVLALTDMPEPQEPRFAEAAREAVHEAVLASRGRAFVLFTSYGLLERTYRALEPRLAAAGLTALRQGREPRDRLLQRFRRERGAVLFAVDSFWEGVDVPGEALSLVVLVRLPFRVPTEPLQEARVEAVERAGGDPFLELSVPQAVVKFRQGFGRLIRTRDDRGAVLVLDPRVTTKRYGRLFLESLPPARVVAAPRDRALGELRRFFGAG